MPHEIVIFQAPPLPKPEAPKTKAGRDPMPHRYTPNRKDAAIVLMIYYYRVVTSQHVEKLFYSPTTHNYCLNRLKLLSTPESPNHPETAYLHRAEQPHFRSEGSRHFVYWLERRGVELVAELLGKPVKELDWRPGEYHVKWLHLEHLIATNHVRVSIEKGARDLGASVETWLDDRALSRIQRQAKEYVTITTDEGDEDNAVVIPDGFFQKSGLFEKRYGSPNLVVHTVAPTVARLETLRRVTESIGGKSRFWFATLPDIMQAENALTAPIWQVAGSNELRSLVW